jgi:hypothetical protein
LNLIIAEQFSGDRRDMNSGPPLTNPLRESIYGRLGVYEDINQDELSSQNFMLRLRCPKFSILYGDVLVSASDILIKIPSFAWRTASFAETGKP